MTPRISEFFDSGDSLSWDLLDEMIRARERGVDLARVYAEAVAPVRRNSWMREYTEHTSGHVCFRRLAGGACDDDHINHGWPAGFDHMREWIKDGKTVLITSEPYGLHADSVEDLKGFCDKNGVDCRIGMESLHFPGRALLLEFTKR